MFCIRYSFPWLSRNISSLHHSSLDGVNHLIRLFLLRLNHLPLLCMLRFHVQIQVSPLPLSPLPPYLKRRPSRDPPRDFSRNLPCDFGSLAPARARSHLLAKERGRRDGDANLDLLRVNIMKRVLTPKTMVPWHKV